MVEMHKTLISHHGKHLGSNIGNIGKMLAIYWQHGVVYLLELGILFKIEPVPVSKLKNKLCTI